MRVLVADDEAKVRFALRIVLERQAGVLVVGETEDSRDLLADVQWAHPDLVLLDWELPDGTSPGALRALRRAFPTVAIVAVSSHPEARRAALAAGADAFVDKSEPPDALLATIRLFTAG